MTPEEAQSQTLELWLAKALPGANYKSSACAWCTFARHDCGRCPLPAALNYPMRECWSFAPYVAYCNSSDDTRQATAQAVVDLLVENEERILEVAKEMKS